MDYWVKKLKMEKDVMIDYQQSFRMYRKWLAWPHCKEVDFELSNWYQNKCRFYNDEIKQREESFWYIVRGILFYLFAIPIVLLVWIILIIFFKIYHRIVK